MVKAGDIIEALEMLNEESETDSDELKLEKLLLAAQATKPLLGAV